jgi:hypothetical protein
MGRQVDDVSDLSYAGRGRQGSRAPSNVSEIDIMRFDTSMGRVVPRNARLEHLHDPAEEESFDPDISALEGQNAWEQQVQQMEGLEDPGSRVEESYVEGNGSDIMNSAYLQAQEGE